jgi:hypothetical protein
MTRTEIAVYLYGFATMLTIGFLLGLMAASKPPCPPCNHKEPADVKTLRRVMRTDSLPRIIMFEDGTVLTHESFINKKK